jgi:hypothetical protein
MQRDLFESVSYGDAIENVGRVILSAAKNGTPETFFVACG